MDLIMQWKITTFCKTYIFIKNLIITHYNNFEFVTHYHNPSLGLTTKARACKVACQKEAQESHFMILGMQKIVKEWTFTLLSEFPFWELESQWTSEFS
jgi:hypothetical protein